MASPAVQPPAPAPKLDKPVETAYPIRYVDLKKGILSDGQNVVNAWNEILGELEKATGLQAETGPEIIPQIDFKDINTLTPEQINLIKHRGSVIIRNVVDDDEALEWKRLLREYADLNPQVDGFPADNKQFFEIYWSRSQLEARSHPNVLAASTFLSNLFHIPSSDSLADPPLVSLSTPMTYADRFRIRQPGPVLWSVHNPHIDGGSIERWEHDGFRDGCYKDILDGKWRAHDPYDMRGRLQANTNIYGRDNQSRVFRTWQGWLAMSHTAPTEGTLRVFPNVHVSNAYLLLRPFFKPVKPAFSFTNRAEFLAPTNWVFDNSAPEFPGVDAMSDGKFGGQRLSEDSHPHMRVDTAMVSIPKVAPGDMAFWHCDVVHSVETAHLGPNDSSVMYIPAVPLTALNLSCIAQQRTAFLASLPPPDFPQQLAKPTHLRGEAAFAKKGVPDDVGRNSVDGKRAMGLGDIKFDAEAPGLDDGARQILRQANQVLYPHVV